ncbi:MAG: hypothetical protein US42_C0006G0050 [Candidatus Magasanikbacteria bacterium GW2011_GWC2_37_14]|uniref:Uncharacterized protein n=1 Tax=Candidatus Magasanikbacteria bacterium GW2011_GWC2_37_14 TaxID=1619046 RepID=A0A0G0G9H0_9BACT|nr:MAG: hypothetical protein US42_C0006G0050 [Candidatus Magasanikbacteria bacterium GW2011_GWC2_37_14]
MRRFHVDLVVAYDHSPDRPPTSLALRFPEIQGNGDERVESRDHHGTNAQEPYHQLEVGIGAEVRAQVAVEGLGEHVHQAADQDQHGGVETDDHAHSDHGQRNVADNGHDDGLFLTTVDRTAELLEHGRIWNNAQNTVHDLDDDSDERELDE